MRVSGETIYLNMTFQAKEPLPVWQWVKARKISATQEVRRELISEFRKIHRLYKNKAVKDLLKYREEQSRELAAAYFNTKEEAEKSILDTLEIIESSGMKLADLEFDRFKVTLAADGRLATLHDADADTPLAFIKDDTVALIKAWYYKNRDGKWILIR